MSAEVATRVRRDVRLSELPIRVLLPLWLALAAFMGRMVAYFAAEHELGLDAHAFWLAGRHADLYGRAPMTRDAYLYSPAFKQVIWPFAQLPWPAFYALWMIAESTAFIWLLRPLGWAWGVPAFLLCGFEIVGGNTLGFLAVVLVAGMRKPALWSFAVLTKVVVAIGPVWFAARREWSSVGKVAIATTAVVAVSVAIAPADWLAWVRFLLDHRHADSTLSIRLAVALVVVVVAARRDTPWLLAPAMVLASPIIHGLGVYLALLTAIPRLRSLGRTATIRSDEASAVT